MVCLLRKHNIPSRLVIGYRPTEFNRLGEYFTVRQRDAHAWVEALFTHSELENTIFRNELTDNGYYWVRFDPTPPPDGELEITAQDGQAMDFAEKLWQEYVVEGQNLASDSGIYAPVAESEDSYAAMLQRLKEQWQDLRSGRLFSEVGFAWPIAILVIALGLLGLTIWQGIRWLPKIAPSWASLLGIGKPEMNIQHPFYARCMKALTRLGYAKDSSETPSEFSQMAEQVLIRRGQSPGNAIRFLTDLYYALRFGKDRTLTPEEQVRIREEVERVEVAVKAAKQAAR